MSNPYKSRPDHCFWSRAVAWCAPGQLDPVVGYPMLIRPAERVGTLGSCFAQHLARHLQRSGLNYFVAEQAPEGMPDAEAKRRNYDVFSARYGNVYTVRQAVQLLDRAFGKFTPADDVWARGDRFVDPFRPTIEPDGYESPEAVRAAAKAHLADVRRVFSESQILVFTLGLTEGWMSKRDGSMYPVAPGVSGGEYDPQQHVAVNFTAAEVISDLTAFIERVRDVNPSVKIILTVSPVPLIATHEVDRHVVVATIYSKSVLRVAAEDAQRRYGGVTYFPSYEIITSPHAQGAYFEQDLRSVSELGVAHVMRVFTKHYLNGPDAAVKTQTEEHSFARSHDVVCDEEEIELALRNSRVKA